MFEGDALAVILALAALVSTLVGTTGAAGPEGSELLLALGAFLALRLCRKPDAARPR